MCRMVAAVGEFDPKLLVEGFLAMAADENEDHEKNAGKKGQFRHEDGWGAAYLDGGLIKVVKSTASCLRDDKLPALAAGLESSVLLLHARKAIGSDVSIENTHPFQEGEYVFCHNGFVRDQLDFDGRRFRWNGQSDSHRFFCHLLTRMDTSDPAGSVKACVKVLRDFTAANIMLLSPDRLICAARYNPPDSSYYRMKAGGDGKCIVVSSELLPSFGGLDWQYLNDGDMAEVNLGSAALRLLRGA